MQSSTRTSDTEIIEESPLGGNCQTNVSPFAVHRSTCRPMKSPSHLWSLRKKSTALSASNPPSRSVTGAHLSSGAGVYIVPIVRALAHDRIATFRGGVQSMLVVFWISMQTRTWKWIQLTLAVVLNFGGGPMSWAQLAHPHATSARSASAATAPSEHCAEHRTQSPSPAHPAPSDDRELPCCAGTACHCGCPPSLSSVTAPSTAEFQPSVAPADMRLAESRLAPPGSFLRPPIA